MFDLHERTMSWLRGGLNPSEELGLLSRLVREGQSINWPAMVERIHELVDRKVLAPDGRILRRPAVVDVTCPRCGEVTMIISGSALECPCGHSESISTIYL